MHPSHHQTRTRRLLQAFESGTLPKERWTHAAHLLTGACYVHRFGEAAAIGRMHHQRRRYNEAFGRKDTDPWKAAASAVPPTAFEQTFHIVLLRARPKSCQASIPPKILLIRSFQTT